MHARVSSIERLRPLPAVLTGADLMRLHEWSAAHVTTQLGRWSQAGAVRPLGGRSDVYFNLIADPDWRRHARAAIARVMPSAVLIGAAPLHAAGWTTQRPRVMDLAVLRRSASYRIEDAVMYQRTRAWYAAMHPGIDHQQSLPCLQPAWALADALCSMDVWAPDPDDLYVDCSDTPEQDFDAFRQAMAACGGEIDLSASRDLSEAYAVAWHALAPEGALGLVPGPQFGL